MTPGPRAAAFRAALEAGMDQGEARDFAADYPATDDAPTPASLEDIDAAADEFDLLSDGDVALLRGSPADIHARIMAHADEYLTALAEPGAGTK